MELSHCPQVERVAIQTNLSRRVDWTGDADPSRLALWCTYHSDQVPYERFLGRCRDLAARGVRFSAGIVGLPEHLDAARRLRADLPREAYLWVNAAAAAAADRGRMITRRHPVRYPSRHGAAVNAARTSFPKDQARRTRRLPHFSC